jgi:thiol-disulfide isomerase/thioredoxin
MHDMHHDNVALHSNGVHAVALDEATFAAHMDKSSSLGLTFVNFYAPWCVWCQRLEPVWEAFAEKSEAGGLPIAIVKVRYVYLCIVLL